MRPFTYERAHDLVTASRLAAATGQGQVDAAAQFLAGGTTLIDLMKLDVLRPSRVVDLGALTAEHSAIDMGPDGLRLGAFAKMSAVADHPGVRARYPVIAESLQLAASAQLRNMATIGGNVLQKTRCSYYRDPTWPACNKRIPGSGCAAIQGFNRNHAILGVDDTCIAQYPGDLAVALIALDAQVEVSGARGSRRFPFSVLHRALNGQPHIETTLHPGELIIGFRVAAANWSWRSAYIKVRDRASYEFAIASAAVALDIEGQVVRQARIALGGMAYRPWRASQAEDASAGAAAELALKDAVTHGNNDYKPQLARQTLVRALLHVQALPEGGSHVG
jgi:xanthine dehydrogenase YagS FAD-binding subunit